MPKIQITAAIAGQPNCGKSTMFNMLTGSTARVGNYPGITVDRMEGYHVSGDYRIKFIDLPGTYSLTAYSMEEIVARDVILNERPDIIVCMLDTMALERSLYLAIQIMEIGIPIIICLNMMDDVRRKGIFINTRKLSELLKTPVIECVARRSEGRDEIISAITDFYKNKTGYRQNLNISYSIDLDPALDEMVKLIIDSKFMAAKYPSRWVALKYMEQDADIITKGFKTDEIVSKKLEGIVSRVEKHTEKTLHTYPEAIISDYRYGYIRALVSREVISRPESSNRRLSESIDKVITQRFIGPVIMLGILYMLFWLTFKIGVYPKEMIENAFAFAGTLAGRFVTNGVLHSLIQSGIIAGVGAVISFAPLILIMFALLCFLEDLGYMARVAYMLDKIFKIFGLHGASVMPYIISGGIPGGCAVPGIMTTRTIKSARERIATILTAPFMVCGAKVTVYLMFAETFFPGRATLVMLLLTISSWGIALIVSKALRLTIIKGESTPFIMELPPYRLPTFYGIFTHTVDRVWQFIKKAGTVILAVSIVMWVIMTYPQPPDNSTALKTQNENIVSAAYGKNKGRHPDIQMNALKYSIGGRIGVALESISQYAGFPWQANIALIGGFAAKEVILSTLSTAYSLGDADSKDASSDHSSMLEERLKSDPAWSLPAVVSLFLFMLLYAPCLTAVVAMARETSWTWAIGGTLGSLLFAYIVSVIVYQLGLWLI